MLKPHSVCEKLKTDDSLIKFDDENEMNQYGQIEEIFSFKNEIFLFLRIFQKVEKNIIFNIRSRDLKIAALKVFEFFSFVNLTNDFKIIKLSKFVTKCILFKTDDGHKMITPCVDLLEHD